MVLELTQWEITPVSVSFILLFLPLSLFVYYVLPARYRKSSLILISGAFLLYVVPNQLPIILAVTAITVILCRKIAALPAGWFKMICFLLSVSLNISVWVFFGLGGWYPNFPYLLGIGVFPFLGIYLSVACYNTKAGNIPIFSSALLYLIFYPRLYVGPLSTIENFWEIGIDTSPAGRNLKKGFEKFVRGSLQFFFLGKRLLVLFSEISGFKPEEITRFSSWIMVISIALGVYHTIAGFMLLSRGLAQMYYIDLPKGFDVPFKAKSLSEFVKRFNRPLLDFYNNTLRYAANKYFNNRYVNLVTVVVVGAFMGLWYGFKISFLIFGIAVALFILLEHFLENFLKKQQILQRLYTYIALILSFAVLTVGEADWNIGVFKALFFPVGTALYNDRIIYLISSNIIILLLSALFAGEMPDMLVEGSEKIPQRVKEVFSGLLHLVMFGILISLLV